MRPLSLKEHEEVVIVREMKKPWPYENACRVFDVVFPYINAYPNGDYECVTVVLTDRNTMYMPEPFGRMSRGYYIEDTKPVKNNALAQRIAKLVEDTYQDADNPWKLVVRRKMFHGNGRRKR